MNLDTAFERARESLFQRRTIRIGDQPREIACLLREIDWRPLKAPWWRGKEACIIGADLDGNFLLRHCDGTVRHWDHKTGRDQVIARSVREFAAQIQ